MQTVYKTSHRNRIIVYAIMAITALMAIRGYNLYLKFKQIEWLMTTAVPLIISFILMPLLYFRKVIITSSSIITNSLLSRKEMFLADILGYQLLPVPRSDKYRIRLTSRSTGKRMIIYCANQQNGDELLEWVQQNFQNLDA